MLNTFQSFKIFDEIISEILKQLFFNSLNILLISGHTWIIKLPRLICNQTENSRLECFMYTHTIDSKKLAGFEYKVNLIKKVSFVKDELDQNSWFACEYNFASGYVYVLNNYEISFNSVPKSLSCYIEWH